MPTEVFEDALDLVIGLLEAEIPSSIGDPSYPYPRLKLLGREETRTFRTLILENPMLRLTVLPDLGGRLCSIFDKRTNIEVLPALENGSATPGGRRGVSLPWGIELYTQGVERLNSLSTTSSAGEPAADADLPAGIWLGESVEGTGLSFHLHITLEPDRPEFTIEAKVFNRTYAELPYNGAFAFHLAGGSATHGGESITYFSPSRRAGLWIDTGESIFDGRSMDEDLVLARCEGLRPLAPRQLDTFRLRIVPFSGLSAVRAANAEAAASLADGLVQIQSSRTRLAHKLVILTAEGQTLEAPVELYSERILEISMAGLPSEATELVLLGPNKEEVLRVLASAQPQMASARLNGPHAQPIEDTVRLQLSAENLHRMTFDISKRHVANVLLAREALTRKEYIRAESYLEQSLLYNAEDHLAWWTKALAARLREGPGVDRPELLNAHFLAPFEPALRAEAFLAQDQQMGKEPSPLLKPLEENPESFVEVAALLTDLGLNDQATRWIDEALRHVDLVMLRYLQAFCYLRASRMHVEAAECVAAAGRLGLSFPLPWREVEWQAIDALLTRFPDDALLQAYSSLR